MTDDNKKNSYSLGIVLLAAALGVVVGLMSARNLPINNSQLFDNYGVQNSISQLLDIVEDNYVDTINRDSLSTTAMRTLLSSLDPHSSYLPPQDFEVEREMMQGHFEGIGVVLHYVHDTVYASNVRAGSPAARAGVHAGDRIMYVDTTLVSGTGMAGPAVVDLIRGPRFSTVKLRVQRGGNEELKEFKIKRDVIMHNSIPAAVMLNKRTGYVRIAHFSETTASELHAALLQLNQEGMRHLVLDLRGNPGGSLESAIEVADELLEKGNLIVYTQGVHQRRSNVYASRGGLFEEGELTVMIDEYSASASEVVSGAIQDNDRGIIVGRRSFGKGLVQRQFDLDGGAAMLLTVARYYTPSGRCIQRPYDKGTDAYYMEYLERLMEDYRTADSLLCLPGDTSQVFLTKKGRKVYGGGGITPDTFIPYIIDSHFVYWNRLSSENVMDEVMYDELFHHYDELMAKYPTVDDFVKHYEVPDAVWNRILALGEKRGVKRQNSSIAKYDKNMRNRYKALLAQSLYDDNAFYKVNLPYDHELQRAMRKNDKKGK